MDLRINEILYHIWNLLKGIVILNKLVNEQDPFYLSTIRTGISSVIEVKV